MQFEGAGLPCEAEATFAPSYELESIVERLSATDWDFRVRVVQHEVESVHPYPAKFIADLPGAFLDALPVQPNTILMDPFCGSGTALAEGQRRGLQTLGVDLNPIACLIARVKTSPLSPTAAQSADAVLKGLEGATAPTIPSIPNLTHWFKPPIQVALSHLMQCIEKAPPADHDFLKLAASSIIVRVSNQDSDTRYAAVEKAVKASDIPELFRRSCERLHSALAARDYDFKRCDIIEGDLLALDTAALRGRVGIFVTSPPYPNAYEYWLYHKYRMWWLGHDPISVKAKEIGARAHFFKKNRHTSETFVGQMTQAFQRFRELAAPGAWVCFVVGRSVIHGEVVDNARIIEDVGQASGFELVYSGTRNVLSTRKAFNLSHANIKTESVIVLRGPC
jgi:site-specific DNA-methyltransferase (cytosine-N4-specific)